MPGHQRDAVAALGYVKALPGGATVVSDGSGALGTSGVEGREVRTNLGFAV